MRNFASNLEKRMVKTFEEHEKMYLQFPIQLFHENVQVCAIALQELKKEYDRFKRNRTVKDEVIYYKECYPVVAKWQIYFQYLLDLEQSIIISYDEMKMKTYKNCMVKLNSDFSKKQKEYNLLLRNDTSADTNIFIESNLNNIIAAEFQAFLLLSSTLNQKINLLRNHPPIAKSDPIRIEPSKIQSELTWSIAISGYSNESDPTSAHDTDPSF
jgi:hypothetical protein